MKKIIKYILTHWFVQTVLTLLIISVLFVFDNPAYKDYRRSIMIISAVYGLLRFLFLREPKNTENKTEKTVNT